MAILSTEQLSYYYVDGDHRRTILNQISVSFEKGVFYTILGESGSGKTTFLSLLAALETPKEGRILFDGDDIQQIGYDRYRRNHVSLVFQNYNLIPYLTAAENVQVAMGITDNSIPGDKQKISYLILEDFGISSTKADRQVKKLSGGEQQRVAIARAVSTQTECFLADEPTGNLDQETSQYIVEIFQRLAHELKKCVIVVTHDRMIANRSDVIFELDSSTHRLIQRERTL